MKNQNSINIPNRDVIEEIQKSSEVIIASPGRINLIGEHLDYNGGYVLPAAIDKHITLYLRKNGTNISNIHTKNLNSNFSFEMNSISISNIVWQNYVLGVLHEIIQIKGKELGGFDCVIESDLPIGSGISSSAALECGLAKGVSTLFNLGLSDMEIITIAQKAEHNFVGTHCGIMDQFSVVKGQKNKLILLDCQSMEFEMIQADFDPYDVVLLNTNVSHELADSEYNLRRAQCEEALGIINTKEKKYKALADVPKSVLLRYRQKMDVPVYHRAKYVVEENYRIKKAVKKIRSSRLKEFGELMYESHEGLRKFYEVSCNELNFLVDFTKNLDYVIGSRMMGGGFGGCTLNLVEKSKVDKLIHSISEAYFDEFKLNVTPIKVSIGSGIRILKNEARIS